MAKVRKPNPPPSQKAPEQPAPPKPVPARKKASRRAKSASPPVPGADLLRMAALAILSVIIWCTVYGRLSAESWSIPVEYGLTPDRADVKSDIAGFKAAQDGYFWPIIFHGEPRLNAPYIGNWNDYPVTEDILIWGTGVLGKVIGLFPACNAMIMMLQVFAALAFYYAARRLKSDWKWAFAGALFFGFAPFAFAHSLHHFVITAYGHMALVLLVCFWITNGPGLRLGTRDYWIAIGIAVLTGWLNVYFTNIFIQLVGIGLIIQWMRHGWRAAIPAFTIGCAAFAAFMVMNLDTIGYALVHGRNPSVAVRVYAHMEYYALKLVDCFVPFPTHRIAAFANIGKRFYTWTILPAEIPPACYFGLVGIAAFLWLAVYTVRVAIVRDRKRIPLEATLVLWTFVYSTVGGVNGMLGVMKFEMFRSTTRFCIVILAISLLFAARRLSLISRRWPSPWPWVAPLLITIAGLWEVLPPTAGEDMRYVAAQVESDRRFATDMERTLPKGGMVFQLPVMDFPESPIPGIAAYEHFRPYFYTQNLRYSYGTDKGRPQDAWQRLIVALTPAQQIAALEKYGFSGIYVNRDGYPDHGESLLAQYKAAGRSDVIESAHGDLFCVVLHPSPNPVLPPPGPLFADGWYTEEDGANGQRNHLASGNAYVYLTNPSDAPVEKYATFYIASMVPRTVTLQGDGAYESWHIDQQHPAQAVNVRLTLPPGESKLIFSTDAPATPGQMGMITFDVVNFDLTDAPKSE